MIQAPDVSSRLPWLEPIVIVTFRPLETQTAILLHWESNLTHPLTQCCPVLSLPCSSWPAAAALRRPPTRPAASASPETRAGRLRGNGPASTVPLEGGSLQRFHWELLATTRATTLQSVHTYRMNGSIRRSSKLSLPPAYVPYPCPRVGSATDTTQYRLFILGDGSHLCQSEL